MKKLVFVLLSSFILISCDEIVVDYQAIIKNQEGIDFLNRAEYDAAIKSFKEAIENPELDADLKATVYRNIAQTFYEMMKIDSSLIYYKLAADCYPKDSYEYLTNVADIKMTNGETSEAEELLLKAFKMKPNNLEANNTLGIIYLGDFGFEFYDPQKALPYNMKAFKINNDRITEEVLAKNYLELANYEKARYHYVKLQNEYPEIEGLIYQLGIVEYLDDNKEIAELYFNKFISLSPDSKWLVDDFKDINE